MGVPGMLTFLRGQGTIKKREFRHSAKAGQGTNVDEPIGPGLVFDNRTLVELLRQEWKKLPRAHPLRFDRTRGGQMTQFRAFCGPYLRQLVEEYQCKIAWVRDAGVNDKPGIIQEWIYEFVYTTCPLTDRTIQSGQTERPRTERATSTITQFKRTGKTNQTAPLSSHTNTVDTISDLYWMDTNDQDFLLGALEDVHLGSAVLVIDAPANTADAEVWRQAQRMAATRETFIVSGDTDMFFFADTSRSNIGVVLLNHQKYESYLPTKVEAVGEQWSCDLGGNVSSRSLRLKFCFVEDVANECNVDVKYLPVLGACLGGDLGMFDRNYHEFTVHLKATLLQKHFKTPAVIAAFRKPEEGLRQELHAVAKARMRGRLGNQPCDYGEFCRRPSCQRTHPAEQNLRCKHEGLPEGRCLDPCCRMGHTRPIGFRITKRTVDRFGGQASLKTTVFDSWEEAVRAVSNIVNERKKVCHGTGPYIPPGVGLCCFKDHRRILFRRTCELVSGHCRNWEGADGEVNMRACARDLCAWLTNISGSGKNEMAIGQALIRAIETYSSLPLEQPLPPVELGAPNRTLETWRMHKFFWISPYPLPSDAGNLNWITEHLRQRIGRELGITDFVEGMQIGSKYVLKRVFCDEGLEAQRGQSPLTHGTKSRPSNTLLEALGLRRETDDEWLQDLQTILQDLPGSLFPGAARKSSPGFHHSDGSYQILERSNDDGTIVPANSIVENLDSIGVLKIVVLSITLWQRVLSSSQVQVPDSPGKLAREKVEALARWEVRVFIGSTILGWVQLQRRECPFDLLAGKLEPGKDDGVDLLFSSIPADLRRRIYMLTAQFMEVVNDVKNMTTILCPGQEHGLRGLREVCFNLEAIFSLYTAVGRAKPEHERDQRVRSKLGAILSTGDTINSARFAEVCDRLVHHVMDTRSNNLDDLATAEDCEDLEDLPI